MRIYVTFMRDQAHKINGVTFNKDCVACFSAKSLQDGKRLAKDLFGDEYEFVNTAAGFDWEINPTDFPDGVKMVKWNRLD